MMAAKHMPEAGVYRCFYLIDGRPAYYIVDYHGVEHEDRIVGEGERERDVIDELSEVLWFMNPQRRGGKFSAASRRPPLRLL